MLFGFVLAAQTSISIHKNVRQEHAATELSRLYTAICVCCFLSLTTTAFCIDLACGNFKTCYVARTPHHNASHTDITTDFVKRALLTVNLHAKSCFADSKLRRICPVEAVDTVRANNSMLSLTTDDCSVSNAHITSFISKLSN